MKWIVRLLSLAGLALTVVPSLFVLGGALGDATNKLLMLIGTLTWLGTAPFWIFKKNPTQLPPSE